MPPNCSILAVSAAPCLAPPRHPFLPVSPTRTLAPTSPRLCDDTTPSNSAPRTDPSPPHLWRFECFPRPESASQPPAHAWPSWCLPEQKQYTPSAHLDR